MFDLEILDITRRVFYWLEGLAQVLPLWTVSYLRVHTIHFLLIAYLVIILKTFQSEAVNECPFPKSDLRATCSLAAHAKGFAHDCELASLLMNKSVVSRLR